MFLTGCLPHPTTVAGHIVLVSRGGCTFQDKVTLIQEWQLRRSIRKMSSSAISYVARRD